MSRSLKYRRSVVVVLFVMISLLNSNLLFPDRQVGEAWGEEPTPIAGEEFRTTLFGEEIYVPPRDRRSVTAMSFGIQAIPNGPSQMEALPFGRCTCGEIGTTTIVGFGGRSPVW